MKTKGAYGRRGFYGRKDRRPGLLGGCHSLCVDVVDMAEVLLLGACAFVLEEVGLGDEDAAFVDFARGDKDADRASGFHGLLVGLDLDAVGTFAQVGGDIDDVLFVLDSDFLCELAVDFDVDLIATSLGGATLDDSHVFFGGSGSSDRAGPGSRSRRGVGGRLAWRGPVGRLAFLLDAVLFADDVNISFGIDTHLDIDEGLVDQPIDGHAIEKESTGLGFGR